MKLGTGFLLLLVAAGAGWKYRGELRSLLGWPPAGAGEPVPATVVYRWVDDKGLTHFEGQPGKGQAVEVDGSRATPLEPIKLGASHKANNLTKASQDPLALHQLREELKSGAERMQEAKVASGF